MLNDLWTCFDFARHNTLDSTFAGVNADCVECVVVIINHAGAEEIFDNSTNRTAGIKMATLGSLLFSSFLCLACRMTQNDFVV